MIQNRGLIEKGSKVLCVAKTQREEELFTIGLQYTVTKLFPSSFLIQTDGGELYQVHLTSASFELVLSDGDNAKKRPRKITKKNLDLAESDEEDVDEDEEDVDEDEEDVDEDEAKEEEGDWEQPLAYKRRKIEERLEQSSLAPSTKEKPRKLNRALRKVWINAYTQYMVANGERTNLGTLQIAQEGNTVEDRATRFAESTVDAYLLRFGNLF